MVLQYKSGNVPNKSHFFEKVNQDLAESNYSPIIVFAVQCLPKYHSFSLFVKLNQDLYGLSPIMHLQSSKFPFESWILPCCQW